jgi:hypothetical protein
MSAGRTSIGSFRVISAGLPRLCRRPAGLLLLALYEHRWLIGVVAVYCVLAKLLGMWWRFLVSLAVYNESAAMVAIVFPVLLLIGRGLWIAAVLRPAHPLPLLWNDCRRWLTAERVLGALICFGLLPPFLSAFASLKAAIPVLNPFSWDVAFLQLDRAIHGGIDPWRLLQPVLGTPLATTWVTYGYHAWYFVVYLGVAAQFWRIGDRQLRWQFITTFFAAWILLGTVVATIFSSAGPCYFGRITGIADPFAGLMAYLDSVGAISRVPQEYLWSGYRSGKVMLGSGISAMPSLHIGMTVLLALAGWRMHPALGALLAGFAFVVMIGSVHLGWHYAVDGYVGAAGTVAIWMTVGWLMRRLEVRRRSLAVAECN